MSLACDLHLHSCVSPCGSLDASPIAIARTAKAAGLDFVALTDHNTALNTPAFAEACRRVGLLAAFGSEVTTAEELHTLAIFETVEAALDFGQALYLRLLPIPHDPDLYGDQVYVDVDETILGTVEKSLLTATEIPLSELVAEVRARGGMVIPAHVDRTAFSAYSQLGFLPQDYYTAIELYHDPPRIPVEGYVQLRNSDAHYLEDIGRRRFWADSPAEEGFQGLAAAIREGRVSLTPPAEETAARQHTR